MAASRVMFEEHALTSAEVQGLVFKEYAGMEILSEQDITQQLELPTATDLYVVLEKVHGANFSFITDGTTVVVAKRTSLLPEGTKGFFSHTRVVERYTSNVIAVFRIFKHRFPESTATRLHIFGELYGGLYNHPDVPKIEGEVFVQKQIQYSPRDEFIAFDISPNGVDFLDYDIAISILREAEIPFVPPLFVGTFAQAARYPTEFPSTIPAMHGLPLLPGNEAEGIVIKHLIGSRPIWKHKNPKFFEILVPKKPEKIAERNQRYALKLQRDKEVSDAALSDPLVETAKAYINENRLLAVASKVGEITTARAPMLTVLLANDAFEDFVKDCAREARVSIVEWKKTTPKDILHAIKQVLPKLAAEVVAHHLQEEEASH